MRHARRTLMSLEQNRSDPVIQPRPMASAHPIADSAVANSIPSKLRDYYALTKPEVNLLILMTTSAGYYLASSGTLQLGRLLITLVGTLLVASGTATFNQLVERRHDARMRRTANRPLVSGRLGSSEAFWFGLVLSAAGGVLLAVSVNLVSAWLAIGTLLGYLLIYTPLKRKTPLCTLLGAVPGAMPTLIGWAAASGGVGRNAWLLFGILFLWQFPHFLAIALLHREDYAVAGFRMLPDFDVDGRFTRVEIVVFSVVLVIVTMLPVGGHGGRTVYMLIMLVAGAFFAYHTIKLSASSSRVLAGRVVHASVIYLPVVLGTMVAWKVVSGWLP
jgi:heme o synthase